MVAPMREQSEKSIVGDLGQYDMRPLSLAGEKVVTRGLGEIAAFIIGRARDMDIPMTATAALPGVKTTWLRDLFLGVQKDVYASKLFALLDALNMEVVVRPKAVPLGRMRDRKKLTAAKLLAQTKTDEPEPEPVATQPVEPEPEQPQDSPLGVIGPELRRELDKMLASHPAH